MRADRSVPEPINQKTRRKIATLQSSKLLDKHGSTEDPPPPHFNASKKEKKKTKQNGFLQQAIKKNLCSQKTKKKRKKKLRALFYVKGSKQKVSSSRHS